MSARESRHPPLDRGAWRGDRPTLPSIRDLFPHELSRPILYSASSTTPHDSAGYDRRFRMPFVGPGSHSSFPTPPHMPPYILPQMPLPGPYYNTPYQYDIPYHPGSRDTHNHSANTARSDNRHDPGAHRYASTDAERTPRLESRMMAGPAIPDVGDHPTVRNVSPTSKYGCSYCGRSFNRPSSLKIHLNSHTGEKPFVCPVESCGRGFSVRSNMRRHARVHEQRSLREQEYSSEEGGDIRVTSTSGYQCRDGSASSGSPPLYQSR